MEVKSHTFLPSDEAGFVTYWLPHKGEDWEFKE